MPIIGPRRDAACMTDKLDADKCITIHPMSATSNLKSSDDPRP